MREGRKFGGFKEHRGASQQQSALKHRRSGRWSRHTPQNTGRIYQLRAEGHESLNAALEPLHKGNPEQRHLQPLPAFERHRRHLTSQPASPPTPAITPSQVLNTPHCQPAKSTIRSPPSPLTPGSRTGWLVWCVPPLPTSGPSEEKRELRKPLMTAACWNIFGRQRVAKALQPFEGLCWFQAYLQRRGASQQPLWSAQTDSQWLSAAEGREVWARVRRGKARTTRQEIPHKEQQHRKPAVWTSLAFRNTLFKLHIVRML